MAAWTIKEGQEKVDEWIKTYGVKYFEPLTNLGVLMEECGELARIMVRLYGEQSFKIKPENVTKDLADEMADVFWILLCLANQCGVDLNQALIENLNKKTNRDKVRHINNPKLK